MGSVRLLSPPLCRGSVSGPRLARSAGTVVFPGHFPLARHCHRRVLVLLVKSPQSPSLSLQAFPAGGSCRLTGLCVDFAK